MDVGLFNKHRNVLSDRCEIDDFENIDLTDRVGGRRFWSPEELTIFRDGYSKFITSLSEEEQEVFVALIELDGMMAEKRAKVGQTHFYRKLAEI